MKIILPLPLLLFACTTGNHRPIEDAYYQEAVADSIDDMALIKPYIGNWSQKDVAKAYEAILQERYECYKTKPDCNLRLPKKEVKK